MLYLCVVCNLNLEENEMSVQQLHIWWKVSLCERLYLSLMSPHIPASRPGTPSLDPAFKIVPRGYTAFLIWRIEVRYQRKFEIITYGMLSWVIVFVCRNYKLSQSQRSNTEVSLMEIRTLFTRYGTLLFGGSFGRISSQRSSYSRPRIILKDQEWTLRYVIWCSWSWWINKNYSSLIVW